MVITARMKFVVCAALGLYLGLAAAAPALAASPPVEIDIPKIGTHAPVVPLGENPDGSMQAPDDPDTVGWFQLGVQPGMPGNALLDGHVDWGGRLRAFGWLKQLEPGDTFQITSSEGEILTYSVAWTRLYDADTAPVDEIFQQTSDEEVTLITCGGAFDRSIHMYVSRWVVRGIRADFTTDTTVSSSDADHS
jgi:LPXTG-site transpeptidase (sortase) family protein